MKGIDDRVGVGEDWVRWFGLEGGWAVTFFCDTSGTFFNYLLTFVHFSGIHLGYLDHLCLDLHILVSFSTLLGGISSGFI